MNNEKETDMAEELKIGDLCPAHEQLAERLKEASGDELAGRKWLVYFYPKDNTPGCTLEAQGFRNHKDDFAALGYGIIGVSRDSATSHERFTEKQCLNFPLLSDKDEVLSLAFDVIKVKPFCGKMCRKVERSTFAIDEKGLVTGIWRDVKAKVHVEELLEELRG